MNIIVTGASRGIGYQTVIALAANPNNKLIAISRSQQGLEKLQQECFSIHANSITIIATDLSTENIGKNLTPRINKEFKNIDVLINNAGAIVNKPLQQITDEDIQFVYGVNVFGTYKLIRDLVALMGKGESKSHIVNISSMGGVQGSLKFPGLSVYSSSKGAVSILTECLAEELKELNICVNCLALGAVQTEMLSEAFPEYKAPMTANAMAAFVASFALSGHQFFNGKIIPVSNSTP